MRYLFYYMIKNNFLDVDDVLTDSLSSSWRIYVKKDVRV